jgi:hypothetical protein
MMAAGIGLLAISWVLTPPSARASPTPLVPDGPPVVPGLYNPTGFTVNAGPLSKIVSIGNSKYDITETVYKDSNPNFLDFTVKIDVLHTAKAKGHLAFAEMTQYSLAYTLAAFKVSGTVTKAAAFDDGDGTSHTTFTFGDAGIKEGGSVTFGLQVSATQSTKGGFIDTGDGTNGNFTPFFIPTGNSTANPTPEPSTLVLACLAGVPFAVAGFRRWRRKDASQ